MKYVFNANIPTSHIELTNDADVKFFIGLNFTSSKLHVPFVRYIHVIVKLKVKGKDLTSNHCNKKGDALDFLCFNSSRTRCFCFSMQKVSNSDTKSSKMMFLTYRYSSQPPS